ncbi:aspartate/glutamate racemase family protein [Lysinibacillus sp. NPDC093688]|uniref:aspartate/glutamate racemase family protein n=1 Tax=Lysinibacillus sp. NPDC093688 TaxID=3390577 RepID=UPI003D00F017
MRKKLGCLHAHHSNIEYIEQAFQNIEKVELVHFVDPGLIQQVSKGTDGLVFKVKEQLKWMESCNMDAILITCTNYIALLEEEQLELSIPIIKIDEPFFETVCEEKQPQMILFTNPETVEGTMNRLQQYALLHEKSINAEVKVINNTFELIIQGKKDAYNNAIIQTLHDVAREQQHISVAQLSMVEAAQQFEKESALTVIHPLKSLVKFVMRFIE